MKIVTYYLGDNVIEIGNSILGKETIKLNGEIVSQKSSIFGAEHTFKVMENGVLKNGLIKISFNLLPLGIQVDLMIDNKPIIKHERSKNVIWVILLFFIFGFIIGYKQLKEYVRGKGYEAGKREAIEQLRQDSLKNLNNK